MENLLTPKNILKSIAGLIVFIILLVTLLKSFYQIESGSIRKRHDTEYGTNTEYPICSGRIVFDS